MLINSAKRGYLPILLICLLWLPLAVSAATVIKSPNDQRDYERPGIYPISSRCC